MANFRQICDKIIYSKIEYTLRHKYNLHYWLLIFFYVKLLFQVSSVLGFGGGQLSILRIWGGDFFFGIVRSWICFDGFEILEHFLVFLVRRFDGTCRVTIVLAKLDGRMESPVWKLTPENNSMLEAVLLKAYQEHDDELHRVDRGRRRRRGAEPTNTFQVRHGRQESDGGLRGQSTCTGWIRRCRGGGGIHVCAAKLPWLIRLREVRGHDSGEVWWRP